MLDTAKTNLQNGPVRLIFKKRVDVDPAHGRVPYLHFRIVTLEGTDVGHLNFKMGDTDHITRYAGHIGYRIEEGFRGHAYSFHACLALRPYLRKTADRIIITSDPDNYASIHIIEKLGARFIDGVDVPPDDPSYKNGARRKRRYEWVL